MQASDPSVHVTDHRLEIVLDDVERERRRGAVRADHVGRGAREVLVVRHSTRGSAGVDSRSLRTPVRLQQAQSRISHLSAGQSLG